MPTRKSRPAARSGLFNTDLPGASLPLIAERGSVSFVKVHEHRKRDGSPLYQIDARRFDETYPQGFFSDDLEKAPNEARRHLKPDLARDAIQGIETAQAQLGVSVADLPRLRKVFRFH
jgi:hypothetical protein